MSQVNVADQAVSFLLAVALGAAAGVFYCFFCALRRGGRNGTGEVLFQDLLFWLVLAVATFCFLLIRCRGEVRGFVYVGQLVGFALVWLLLSRYIIKFFLFILRILGLFRAPVDAFFAFSAGLIAALCGKMRALAEKVAKKFEKAQKKA